MEVWKEFFRLKWEEISDWWNEYLSLFVFILSLFLVGVHFGVSFSCLVEKSHWIRYTFWIYPITLFSWLFYIIIKWLHSNWQQAKINVENRK